jgi:SAM-dependent methyltransferase
LSNSSKATNNGFDEYASNYDAALAEGISVSGEGKEYFAQGRIEWLAKCLNLMGEQPANVMDYGCGTGSATPYFLDSLKVGSLLGVDASVESLKVARQKYNSDQTQFVPFSEYVPGEQLDLAFCNGVFHHIPLDQRDQAVEFLYRSLRPGGVFAFWENNPWNPGTRIVMKRIPFDRDAITLSAPEARRMLRRGGFEIVRTDFLFIFPRLLSSLRVIEPLVSRLPLGAQYQILCRKPASPS